MVYQPVLWEFDLCFLKNINSRFFVRSVYNVFFIVCMYVQSPSTYCAFVQRMTSDCQVLNKSTNHFNFTDFSF